MNSSFRFLNTEQAETLHRSALRVLAEHGVCVEHEEVAARLGGVGGVVHDGDRVRFPAPAVEAQLTDAGKTPLSFQRPRFGAHVGVYECRFLDPASGRMLVFDEALLARYIAFAQTFAEIDYVGMLGLPFCPAGMAGNPQPLLEKVFAWKYGAVAEGAVHDVQYCEPLLEMFRCHAAATGRALREVVAACGFMISPLRLARGECEQLLWFAGQDLTMRIGSMPSMGGTAPVTLAGTVTLMLAEQIFQFLLRKAMYGHDHFGVGVGCCTMDLRNGYACYGRPEQYRVTLAMADLARFYGCACYGHSGLSDAKVPSAEAGAQKMMGLMATGSALGHASVSAGLLSMDEVCSPVQMVLDLDMVNSLNALHAAPAVDEEACAVGDILAAGPGGNHLGTDLTAERCRTGMFHPRTWSPGLLARWQDGGGRTDVDQARAVWEQFCAAWSPASAISADEEEELWTIVRKCAIRA